MSSVQQPTDLHPEDLIARACGEGETLSTDERAHLDAHLEECEVCALEVELHGGFEADLAAQPGDASKLSAMVAVAVGHVPPPAGPGPGVPAPTPGISAGGWIAMVTGLVVVVVAAVVATSYRSPAEPSPEPRVAIAEVPSAQAPVEQPTVVATPPDGVILPTADPPPSEHVEVVPNELAPTEPEPAAEDAEVKAKRPSAAEIFARANRYRRAGEYDESVRGYEQLQREYQGSREALLSRVSLGKLYLSRLDRPQDALRMFESYLSLRPEGTLAEEAAVGRASALQKLGRRAEEREAWQNVLERFPETVHAERAAQRLR